MTFIFRNRTIFWEISKWNREQKKWEERVIKKFTKNMIINGRTKFRYSTFGAVS